MGEEPTMNWQHEKYFWHYGWLRLVSLNPFNLVWRKTGVYISDFLSLMTEISSERDFPGLHITVVQSECALVGKMFGLLMNLWQWLWFCPLEAAIVRLHPHRKTGTVFPSKKLHHICQVSNHLFTGLASACSSIYHGPWCFL